MIRKALVILSYNHVEQTQQCLRSLDVASEWPREWRVILVHNGSRPEIVSQLQASWPYVDHHVLSVNRGFSGGMNAGIAHALVDSEAVLALTNDTKLLQLPEHLPAGIGVPLIARRHEHIIDSCGGHLDLWHGKLRHLRSVSEFERWVKHPTFYIPGTAFSVDRATWQALGGFDESLFCLWEDVDWGLRARARNLPIMLLEDCRLLHKVGKTMHRKSYYTSYLFHRNRRLVLKRHARHYWQRQYQQMSLAWSDWRMQRRLNSSDPERRFWFEQRRNLGERLPEQSYRPQAHNRSR